MTSWSRTVKAVASSGFGTFFKLAPSRRNISPL